ncbi:unnamed protein product [Paramecium pentaurelia]|uniref:Uncharacterized protein n=1 Tax=Paramecium pentaurelia TaxID=43138 RepID=A0A8S1XVZ7_9CILI|nr:unnamed protein product [Paramecium pentaurelia]
MLNTNSNQFVHSKLIYACAISPKSTIDNQRIILGTIGSGGQQIIQLQSAQEGYKIKTYHLHNAFSAKLLFLNQTEGNDRFVSAGEKLQIFKSEDQKISHICDLIPLSKEYVGPTFALDFHYEQQNRLISGSLDPTIRIWDLEKRKCQYQFIAYDISKEPDQYTLDLNLGRDSNILAFLNNYNQIGIYDIRTKMGMHKIKGKLQYNQVIWNKKQENNLIAIDYEAGLIDFYDTRDFKNKYKRIRTDHRQIVKAEWFQDRNSLVTAGLDRQIILYEGDKYLEPCLCLTKNYDIDNFCCQNNLFGVVSEYSFEVFSFETQ